MGLRELQTENFKTKITKLLLFSDWAECLQKNLLLLNFNTENYENENIEGENYEVTVYLLFCSNDGQDIFEIFNKHEKFPEFSSKIQIQSNEDVGRFTTAQENIEPFETVLVEEPFAKVLYVEKNGFNCTHCLKRLKTAIPCKKCSGVAFCSVFCRDEAQESYHQWECLYQVS